MRDANSLVFGEMEKKKLARAIRNLNGSTKRYRAGWLYGCSAVVSIALFALFWCTNVFRDAILSNLVLRNGTASFLLWQRPPIGLTFKVYVFNYTNVREFESGNATKLRVEEVGPFVYRESLSRVNVQLHDNHTITYQEKRNFRWVSGLSEKERVVVPNVVLMSILATSRNVPYAMQVALTLFFATMREEPFIELPVGEYLWGYEDKLFQLIKPFAFFVQPIPFDKFGILAIKNGVNTDRVTMHTGADDIRNLGMVERINGLSNQRTWGDERCDRIYGTDGSVFPLDWIEQQNSTLYMYARDICRQLPFRYERRGFSNGIPVFRYKLSSNIFTSTGDKDSCFCPKESRDSIKRRCPPAGTFNVSACKFGAPLIVSLPHFYSGEESLFDKIDGLAPREEHRENYIDLHPRLGITVNMKMRFQLNIEVRKAVGMPFSGKLQDGLILPFIWIESGIEELPESIRGMLYRSYYLANAIEAGFQWCSLVAAILSLCALLAAIARRDERSSDANLDPSKSDASMVSRTELHHFSNVSLS